MSMHFVVSCLQYVKWNIIYTNIILARSFINILYSFCVMADNKISMALYLLFYSCNITFFTSVNIFLLKSVVVSQIKLSSASKPCAADRVFIIRVLCLAHAEMLMLSTKRIAFWSNDATWLWYYQLWKLAGVRHSTPFQYFVDKLQIKY